MIITIDGPSGTGKSTVAKRVAEQLRFHYFDTGAMYRMVALLILERGIHLADQAAISDLLGTFSFRFERINGEMHYFTEDRDVTKEIRSPAINQIVSPVSAMPAVREALWRLQRHFAQQGSSVFEGRDMGSVVFPDADIKIFLTARPEVRAERRLQEMIAKKLIDPSQVDLAVVLQDIIRRDEYDSTRALAPLKCPKDALVIDTSDLTIDEVVQTIIEAV